MGRGGSLDWAGWQRQEGLSRLDGPQGGGLLPSFLLQGPSLQLIQCHPQILAGHGLRAGGEARAGCLSRGRPEIHARRLDATLVGQILQCGAGSA